MRNMVPIKNIYWRNLYERESTHTNPQQELLHKPMKTVIEDKIEDKERNPRSNLACRRQRAQNQWL